MVKDYSDSERGNPLSPLHRLIFPISSKVLLYAPSHRQDSTYHLLCYTSRRALAGGSLINILVQYIIRFKTEGAIFTEDSSISTTKPKTDNPVQCFGLEVLFGGIEHTLAPYNRK